MSQNSLWQTNQQSNEFAEICNALYERELRVLANSEFASAQSVQGRLKSLSYYVNRTANAMTQIKAQGKTPLNLDTQNASWSAKQAAKLSLTGQAEEEVSSWYLAADLVLGLVVPILKDEHVFLDCIDRIDKDKKRFRTNASGWLSLEVNEQLSSKTPIRLLKPNKRIMISACAGHNWQNGHKVSPIIPSLRELLLSCAINWQNFHKII